MSKRAENKEKNLALLQAIKEKRHILFGSFAGNKLTASEKEEFWTEVHEYAASLGLSSGDKKWTYTRDNLFGLWKSRALAKRDNARKTGTGGGKGNKIDEVDEIIFDIINVESPVLDGINVPESSGGGDRCFPQTQNAAFKECVPQASQSVSSKSGNSSVCNGDGKRKPDLKRKPAPAKEDTLKKLKEDLLYIEIYKAKLEAFKLERDLKLSASEFTEDLERKLKNNQTKLNLTSTLSSLIKPLCNYSGNSGCESEESE